MRDVLTVATFVAVGLEICDFQIAAGAVWILGGGVAAHDASNWACDKYRQCFQRNLEADLIEVSLAVVGTALALFLVGVASYIVLAILK